MPDKDIRWQQRFANYKRALRKLSEAVEMDYEEMSELEVEGLIQRFEYTYELAWRTLWNLLIERGHIYLKEKEYNKPAPVIEQALKDEYITNEKGWKKMRDSRNLTSHTYDEETADEIANDTIGLFHSLFLQLETRLEVERLS